jgi:hypothetical protein
MTLSMSSRISRLLDPSHGFLQGHALRAPFGASAAQVAACTLARRAMRHRGNHGVARRRRGRQREVKTGETFVVVTRLASRTHIRTPKNKAPADGCAGAVVSTGRGGT